MPRNRYNSMLEALGLCLAARITPLLWAGPGVGKTSVVESLTQQGYLVETVICSHYEPVDFAGLPIISGNHVTLAPPAWGQRVNAHDGPAIVFFDEWSTATPATQAAALRPLTHHEVGSLKLNDNVRFIAAANPTDLAAGGWDLKAPTSNRFCHLDWILPLEVFSESIVTGNWPALSIPEPRDDLKAHHSLAVSLVAGFVTARPNLLNSIPSDPVAQGGAFPTPRSWEYAARLLAWANASGATTQAAELAIAGVVGPAAAHELLTFIRHNDLPDPELLLGDPSAYDFAGARADHVNVILNSIVARVTSNPSPERWCTAVALCARAADESSLEAAVPAVRALMRPGVRPNGVAVPGEIRVFAAPLALAGLLEGSAA